MTNNTSSDKNLRELLKNIIGGISVGILLVSTLVNFINLWAGNKGITTVTMLVVGVGVIETSLIYIYCKKRTPENSLIVLPTDFSDRNKKFYSRKICRTALSLATMIFAVSLVTIVWAFRPKPAPHKFVVLVADFDSSEQEGNKTAGIFMGRLREATKKYPEIEIQALHQAITELQDPDDARKIGKDHNANIVLWGWYAKTNSNVLFTVHFEVVNKPKYLEMEHDNQMLNVALVEMDHFDIQTNLSNEMNYLTFLVAGLARYDSNDYEGAVERFTDALNLPTNPKEMVNPSTVYFRRGNSYFAERRFDEAIADYTKALSLNFECVCIHDNLGLAYENKGELDLAISEYNKAISLDPDDAWVYNSRGITHMRKGEADLAILDFSKAISLNSDDAHFYFHRGLAYSEKMEFDLALADYNKVISLRPSYAEAYNNRGSAYGGKEEYDLAIADFNKALSLKPNLFEAYANRGSTRNNIEEYDQAIADCSQAISLKSDYASAYFIRGVAHFYKEEYDQAIADCSQAITLRPDLVNAHITRGVAHDNKEEYDMGIADYNQALSLDPNNAIAYNDRGAAHDAKGEYPQAFADCNKAISLKPDLAQAYDTRGSVYEHKGDHDHAIADYTEAIRLKPDYAEAYINRGKAQEHKGEPDLARADFNKAEELKLAKARK